MGINTSKECLEEALDKISQSMISSQTKVIVGYLRERDKTLHEALNLAISQRDHNLYSARLMTEAAEEAQEKYERAVSLLSDVVVSRDLEKESYNLHNKIEEFINEN